MSDETPQKRSLSEISHLFLSSVRDKQTQGAPRPRRIPPGQARSQQNNPPPNAPQAANDAVDLTAEEFARVFAEQETGAESSARRTPPVTAVLGAHLNGRQFDRVKEYARHLALIHGRIGLIEIDASEFRLMSFEAGNSVLDPDLDHIESAQTYEPREMAEALEEMNWDVDRWLLLVTNPRTPEARALLRAVGHWALLSTCDHDGVVSSYRTLKGLAESFRPRVSLALLDATDSDETERVYRKLSSVCQQFLNWELEGEPSVRKATQTVEHLALCCRPTRDKGQIAAAPQWAIVAAFLESIRAETTAAPAAPAAAASGEHPEEFESMEPTCDESAAVFNAVAEIPSGAVKPPRPSAFAGGPKPAAAPAPEWDNEGTRDNVAEVIDLPVGAGSDSILSAILQQNRGEMIECPVCAPMCAGARLAITRDRRIVLMAIAREGLADLRSIGQAYRWVSENRALITMALPQFAIEAGRLPLLRLLVDHGDISADVLQPILQADHVTIQAYRKVRWGGRTGLFLEAA